MPSPTQTFSLGFPLDDADDLDGRYADAMRKRVHDGVTPFSTAVEALMKHGWTLGAARRELAGFED